MSGNNNLPSYNPRHPNTNPTANTWAADFIPTEDLAHALINTLTSNTRAIQPTGFNYVSVKPFGFFIYFENEQNAFNSEGKYLVRLAENEYQRKLAFKQNFDEKTKQLLMGEREDMTATDNVNNVLVLYYF
jgi:hypothetical protein